MIDLTRKIEIHYVFVETDHSHTLNASTRNKCEHAFLQIACEVARELDIQVQVLIEPHSDGGLKDLYTFVFSSKGANMAQWGSLLTSIISLALMMPNKQDSSLKQLSITEKHLSIKKLRLEIAEIEHEGQIDQVPDLHPNNPKIKRQRSNFFQKVNSCSKIQKIEMSEIDASSGKPIPGSLVSVDRTAFNDYIVEEIEIAPEIWENAVIEIIAPVLVTKGYQWKGVLKVDNTNQVIDFQMKDKQFKEDVQAQRIAFTHGTHIECVLELVRRVDLEGNVFVARHDVTTVNKYYNGAGTNIETLQGKNRKRAKELERQQMTLFL
jgi:hypothetical protein